MHDFKKCKSNCPSESLRSLIVRQQPGWSKKRGSQKPFLISSGRAVPATLDMAAQVKLWGFFQSFIPLSVPCSLDCNFKQSFLGALRTHKDDKWSFLCWLVCCLTSHPSMPCCSVLPRVIVNVWQHSVCPTGHAGLGLPAALLFTVGCVQGVGGTVALCWMPTSPWHFELKCYYLLSLQTCTKFSTLKADSISYFWLTEDMMQPIYFLIAFSQLLCS